MLTGGDTFIFENAVDDLLVRHLQYQLASILAGEKLEKGVRKGIESRDDILA